ncbi:MAG: hypothetical protein FD134_2808, partial [Gallionellaceae bacterium]
MATDQLPRQPALTITVLLHVLTAVDGDIGPGHEGR